MKQNVLDAKADAIEALLQSHRIEATVTGGTVTPRFVRFDVHVGVGTRVRKVLGLQEELALVLGVSDVRVYRQRKSLRVEVPRSRPGVVKLPALCKSLPRIPPASMVLGVDDEGVPLLLHLPSPDVAHVLVAGATGSGKTALLRSMILSLAIYQSPRALQFALIDPKGRGLAPFARLPHLLQPVVSDAEASIVLLERLVREMERRDRQRRHRPRLVIVIDELADLRMVGGAAVERLLTRLTQRGREAGLHVIVATQRPAASVMGGLVKANLPVRLVGAVSSPEDAKVATGIAGSGAHKLLGRGDFLLVSRGKIIRFQAAYIPERQAQRMVQGLAGGTRAPARTLS